jgi:hypothetical protein
MSLFAFGLTILRTCLALRWGAQLVDVQMDVPCVCVADVRWGAQLADVPCVALGCPTCGRALRCVGAPNLGEAVLNSLPPSKIFSYPFSSSSFSLVFPCVDVFVADRFFVWAPILRTCLALRFGAHLADAPFVALGRPTLVRPY